MSKPDLSALKPPIQLGSSGVQYLMECIETGTEEVKSAIFDECEVLMECRVCKSIFRALPNFLAHKRFYCVEAYQDTRVAFLQQQPEEYTVIVEPKSPPNEDSKSEEDVYIVEQPEEPETKPAETKPPSAKPPSTEFYDKTIDRIKKKTSSKKEQEIELIKVPGNPNAVKQQVKRPREEKEVAKEEPEKKKAPVSQPPPAKKSKMDLRANPKPKVKPDKMMVVTYKERLARLPSCNINNLKCLICKTFLSSHKSLYNHMMTQHSSVRTYYPCPYCKNPFTKLYSLTVHLERQHKKNKTQIEKMRSRLRRSAFKKSVKDASRVTIDTKSTPKGKVSADPKMSPVVSLTPCVGTHKCDQCERTFVKKDSLKRHLPFCLHPRRANPEPEEGKEESEVPLADVVLFSGFSNEMLKKVESLMDQGSSTCRKCETDFDSIDELHCHVIKHLGLKRFKCKLCKFSCPNRSECKSHLQSNHASQVVGFSLMQFRTYIIDLQPEKPLPRIDFVSPKTVGESSPSKRTLAFKSKKDDCTSSSEEREIRGGEVKVTSKRPATRKVKAAQKEQEALEVLSTRSGVKYKKPSLEEFLQSREKKNGNDVESSEEEEKETKKKAARGREETKSTKRTSSAGSQKRGSQSPKAQRTKDTPKQGCSSKEEKKVPGKATKAHQVRNSSPGSKEGKEKVNVKKEQKKKERSRSTPPRILRDPKASNPVVTIAPPTSSPPLTASDLLKQRKPAKPSPVKVTEQPFTAFDLSKAKVILSPLMAPGSPNDQLGQSLIATTTTSSPQKGLQRIAPKPATNDFIVLVEKPSGVNKVLDAVNRAAATDKPVSNNVMYILKDGKLIPATQAVAGMTSVTVGGNPDVAGSCKVISVENINSSHKVSEQSTSSK